MFYDMQIENHGVDKELMDKVKKLVNKHYEDNMKPRFYSSEIVKTVEDKSRITNTDWESTFFIWHRPEKKINECPDLSEELRLVSNIIIHTCIEFYVDFIMQN